jgi:hypothetical protein
VYQLHENNKILHTVHGERNILHTINRRKANCIGHILRGNVLLKHVIDGKIRGNERSDGKRRKKT